MTFRIVIQEVKIEEVRNGKNKYDKAEVVYSSNGQNRTQKIMSFSNPAIFAQVRKMVSGETYDVEVVKNDAGFNQWAKIVATSGEAAPVADGKPAPAGRTSVSTYETAEERKIKQMYIIKQSSISSAIEFSKHPQFAGAKVSVEDLLVTAQQFVDFVYGNQEADLFQEDNDLGA